MIGIAQHAFKQQPGLVQLFGIRLTCPCQRFYEPKGAHVESAFLARKSVDAGLRRISIDKAVTEESAIARILENGAYGAEHPRIGRSHEEDQRHDQKRCIQVLTAVKLGKGAALLVPSFGHYFLVDVVSLAHPLGAISWKRTFVGQSDAAIQSNPVHNFRVHEVLLAITHLPNTGITKLPVFADPLKPLADLHPNVV